MRYEPFDWYEDCIYYDIVFDEDTAAEVRFLEALYERHATPTTHARRAVLEPACGSGRLLAALGHRDWSATGFDASDGMLAFARDRLRREQLSARLENARMESFDLGGGFDLAHCLVSTFKHLLDGDDAARHLKCVAESLRPGGVYVLGMHLTDYTDRHCTHERWIGRRDGIEVVCNIRSWPANRRQRTERVRARLRVRQPGDETERCLESIWTFRTYGLGQLRSLLRQVPMLQHVATYTFRNDPDEAIPLDGERLDVVLVLRRRTGS